MSLSPAEQSALDALLAPDGGTLGDALTELGIDPSDYLEAIDAKREFPEYLLAVAIQDLWIAGSLTAGTEVVNIARKYWPIDIKEN